MSSKFVVFLCLICCELPLFQGGEVANYENIKDKGFDHRTTDELRIITSKGGKASGKARRRKADFRKKLNMLLTAEIDSEEWNEDEATAKKMLPEQNQVME